MNCSSDKNPMLSVCTHVSFYYYFNSIVTIVRGGGGGDLNHISPHKGDQAISLRYKALGSSV